MTRADRLRTPKALNSLAKWYRKRTEKAVRRWQSIAELRAKGQPLKVVARQFGISIPRACILEQKWHSYRISQRNPLPPTG